MALALEKSIFYHPGRTGGHWVNANLHHAGLVRAESDWIHDNPLDLAGWAEQISRPYSLCFVRHPLTWVRSLWIHETHFGWTHGPYLPRDEFGSFADYLEDMMVRYPEGMVSRYFAPFVDNVTVVGKVENLATDLFRLLRQLGETVPEQIPHSRRINKSVEDIVSFSARAPKVLLERFMEREAEFCRRFGYEGIPAECVLDESTPSVSWFPVFPAMANGPSALEQCCPLNTFLFSDGSVWRGRPDFRRLQLAIRDAINNSPRTGASRFLELECGDGFFVFLAEQLGFQSACGIDTYLYATTKLAISRMESKARFLLASPYASLNDGEYSTILIKTAINNTPWPHLLLLNAKAALAVEGEILLGCLTFEPEVDPGVCISISGEAGVLPVTCPYLMSVAYLRNIVAACGLEVVEVCSDYDEVGDGEMTNVLDQVNRVVPGAGMLRRVVWRLRSVVGGDESEALRFWLRGQTLQLVDYVPEDPGDAAFRTVKQLYALNVKARGDLKELEVAIHDREMDLAKERANAAVINEELLDRTTRLEHALAELTATKAKACDDLKELEVSLHDREMDLARERADAAMRSEELLDRTTRLEHALAELDAIKAKAGGDQTELEVALHDREMDLARERADAVVRSEELLDRTTRLVQALAELDRLRNGPSKQ